MHHSVDTDIASNKPVTASSTWTGDTHRFGPQFATNGQSVCGNDGGPIALTNKGPPSQWFKVDLQGTFYIKTVVVNPRTRMFYLKM